MIHTHMRWKVTLEARRVSQMPWNCSYRVGLCALFKEFEQFSAFHSGQEFILLSFYMGHPMRIHLLSSNSSLTLVPFARKNHLFCGNLQDLFDSPSYPIGFCVSASYFLGYSSLLTRFLSIFKFILRKFHRCIQCIPIIFTQHSLPPTPGLLPMHLLLAS